MLVAVADNTPAPVTLAASSFLGRKATGDAGAMTAAEAQAILPDVVGDAGIGGTAGRVPAPAAGDAVAGKYLKADGLWQPIPPASDTVPGIVELADAAEMTAGVATDRAATAAGVHAKVNARTESFIVPASDETTPLTVGTAKTTFRMPYGMNLTEVRASLTTPQTSGAILTVNVRFSATTIFSTKPTIDNGERTSKSAVTQPVLSDTVLADDEEGHIDVDQIGDGTAKGLKITFIGTR